jgi:hypothetical protein
MQITSGEHLQYWSAMSPLMSAGSRVSRISFANLKFSNFSSAEEMIGRVWYTSEYPLSLASISRLYSLSKNKLVCTSLADEDVMLVCFPVILFLKTKKPHQLCKFSNTIRKHFARVSFRRRSHDQMKIVSVWWLSLLKSDCEMFFGFIFFIFVVLLSGTGRLGNPGCGGVSHVW